MTRKTSAARGYGHRWRKERAAFLAQNPWCRLQGSGCLKLASLVDHIQPHRGDEELFWRVENWQPLCSRCHSMHKQRAEGAYPERDRRGRLISITRSSPD